MAVLVPISFYTLEWFVHILNFFCQIFSVHQIELQTHIWMLFKHMDLILPFFSFICANLDLFGALQEKGAVQRIWMLFKHIMVWSREATASRFVSHGNVKLLLWTTRLFTVYSQCAIHDFPLKFIICKQFPCLILHNSKCNFTCHTHSGQRQMVLES